MRIGLVEANKGERADVQALIGHCSFASPDADLPVSLLPEMVVISGEERLSTLVALLRDEARALRPARDAIVEIATTSCHVGQAPASYSKRAQAGKHELTDVAKMELTG